MTDTPPDDLIERIVAAARAKYPNAEFIDIRGGSWLWTANDNKTDSYKAHIEVETCEGIVFGDAASDLPALLEQLTAPADKGGSDGK